MQKAGVILINHNKILVVLGRDQRKWSFPKGQIDETDKTIYDCAIRELYEETGIQLQIYDVCIATIRVDNVFYFIYNSCQRYKPAPKDHKEIMTAKWMKLSTIISLNCNSSMRKILLETTYIQDLVRMIVKQNIYYSQMYNYYNRLGMYMNCQQKITKGDMENKEVTKSVSNLMQNKIIPVN